MNPFEAYLAVRGRGSPFQQMVQMARLMQGPQTSGVSSGGPLPSAPPQPTQAALPPVRSGGNPFVPASVQSQPLPPPTGPQTGGPSNLTGPGKEILSIDYGPVERNVGGKWVPEDQLDLGPKARPMSMPGGEGTDLEKTPIEILKENERDMEYEENRKPDDTMDAAPTGADWEDQWQNFDPKRTQRDAQVYPQGPAVAPIEQTIPVQNVLRLAVLDPDRMVAFMGGAPDPETPDPNSPYDPTVAMLRNFWRDEFKRATQGGDQQAMMDPKDPRGQGARPGRVQGEGGGGGNVVPLGKEPTRDMTIHNSESRRRGATPDFGHGRENVVPYGTFLERKFPTR